MPAWCGDGGSGLPKRHAYTYAARLLRRGKGARQNRAAGGRWHLESTRNCRYSARPGSHLFTGFSAGCWPSLGDWSRVCSFIAAPGRTTGALEGALRGAAGGGMQSGEVGPVNNGSAGVRGALQLVQAEQGGAG